MRTTCLVTGKSAASWTSFSDPSRFPDLRVAVATRSKAATSIFFSRSIASVTRRTYEGLPSSSKECDRRHSALVAASDD